MSSLYVRQSVRGWLNDAKVVTPFYDTINTDQSPVDNTWCTADFNSLEREVLTICAGELEESGEIEVIFWGQPGIGDAALLSQAERDMDTLMSFRDPLNALILTARSAPEEFTGGDSNELYGVLFSVDYTYYV